MRPMIRRACWLAAISALFADRAQSLDERIASAPAPEVRARSLRFGTRTSGAWHEESEAPRYFPQSGYDDKDDSRGTDENLRGHNVDSEGNRELKKKSSSSIGAGGGGSGSGSSGSGSKKAGRRKRLPPPPPFRMMNVTITNLSFQQPFSKFFVLIYDRNDDIDDALEIEEPAVFRLGEPASPALRRLAEHGDPTMLMDTLAHNSQVWGAFVVPTEISGGQSVIIQVPDNKGLAPADRKRSAKRRISIVAKLQNTNDGFVALNGAFYRHRSTLFAPAYDAGTEENNENCASVPGPACSSVSGNVDSGNGEGYVHIHRGISGKGGTLTVDEHDWKNPIMEAQFIFV